MKEAQRLSTWEMLLEEAFSAGGTRWGVYCYNRLESTMDQARVLLKECSEERPLIVLASDQTKGRGRQGRSWLSSHEGLYLTYVFKTKNELRSMLGLPLVVGCVTARVLRAFGCEVGLKWPNDLLALDGRKLSGTLIEVVTQGRDSYVLVGLGVNLRGEVHGFDGATTIFDLIQRPVLALDLVKEISQPMLEAWEKFLEDGFSAFREEWISNSICIGRLIGVESDGILREGLCVGLGPNGELEIELAGKRQLVVAGDVSISWK